MSRAIKFRAWDGRSIRYDVTGFEHGRDNEMVCVFLNGDCYAIGDRSSQHPNAEVMQFTGLTDRNGVEIYEGDILESEHPVMPYPNKPKLLVEWMNDKNNWNGWNFIPSVIDDFGMTVIGNIYENSELLEAKP